MPHAPADRPDPTARTLRPPSRSPRSPAPHWANDQSADPRALQVPPPTTATRAPTHSHADPPHHTSATPHHTPPPPDQAPTAPAPRTSHANTHPSQQLSKRWMTAQRSARPLLGAAVR